MNKEKVTVIIPSLDGKRGGNVERLKASLGSQTVKPYEIIVVIGVSPNGRARNVGVERAKKNTDFFVFIDDDVILGHERVLENLIKPFLHSPEYGEKPVGMTGPSQLIPEDSNWFQKAAARQIPRSVFPVQKELVDSDMVTHMCLCMSAGLFIDLGMENPDIIAGTDPDLRHRVREAGYRVCVVPDTWAYHPMPERLSGLMKMAFYKGRNSALVRRTHPDLVLELDTGFKREFRPKRSLAVRVLRLTGMIFISVFKLHLIFTAYTLVYSAGNLFGSLMKLPENEN